MNGIGGVDLVRTIAVLASKGGTGKTTVSVHLACAAMQAGHRSLIADLDPQHSAMEWARERKGRQPLVVEARVGTLFNIHSQAELSRYDLLVIDTRPSAEADSVEAVRQADLCVVVVRPSFFDMRSIASTVDLVERQRKRAVFVVNQAPPRRAGKESPVMLEAVENLRRMGLPVAQVGLRSRAAYQQALSLGLSAQEAEPLSTAASEIGNLWRALEAEVFPPAAPLAPRLPPQPMFRPAPPPADFREVRPGG